MSSSRTFFGFLAIFVMITSISAVPMVQTTPDGQLFQSGFRVSGPFLEFYKSVPDPYLLLGFPISDVMDHPQRQGTRIQYFNRARLDLDTVSGEGKVELAPLGEYLYDNKSIQHGQKADFAVNTGACRRFSTGFSVCYAFLQFYNAHDGATYFGDPISDTEVIDGRLVQYFTRSRMEWRPENPSGQRVVLTDVGKLDMESKFGFVETGTNPPGITSDITSIQILVRAFPDRPLLASGSQQKIFVIVQDQAGHPVQGALVMVVVHMPDGTTKSYRPDGTTNADGFIQVPFDVNNVQPNQVITVTVNANIVNGPSGQTETWFRIWW